MKIDGRAYKKLTLWAKMNIALSILLLALSFYGMLKNIHEGNPFYAGSVIFSFLIGSLYLTISYLKYVLYAAKSEGKIIGDERSKRAVEKAGLFAFLLLIAILMVTGVINSAFDLGLEYTLTVNVIYFACIFAWILLTYYLDRKEEAL